MATVVARRTTVPPDVVMKFRGVGWKGFQHAKALVGEDPPRITYANGDLLVMSPGAPHEAYVEVFGDLVKAVGRAFRIPTRSLASTLWERRGADAGKEPDASFYVASAARIKNRIPNVDTDPVPDLAIEVEISNPIDLSLKAYANLGVAEVWHFARRSRRASSLRFLRLEQGGWVETATSLAFPMLKSTELLLLIERAALLDDLDRADLLEEWIRTELRPPRRRRKP